MEWTVQCMFISRDVSVLETIICFRSGLQQILRDFLKVKQVLNCCPAVGWTSAPLNSPRQKRASFLKHVLHWIKTGTEDRGYRETGWGLCLSFTAFKRVASHSFLNWPVPNPLHFTKQQQKRGILICSLGRVFPALPMALCSLVLLGIESLSVTAQFQTRSHKEMTQFCHLSFCGKATEMLKDSADWGPRRLCINTCYMRRVTLRCLWSRVWAGTLPMEVQPSCRCSPVHPIYSSHLTYLQANSSQFLDVQQSEVLSFLLPQK